MPLSMRPSPTLTEQEVERFWSKVDRAGECWIWTGNTPRDGYGRAWAQGSDWLAYRLAYELVVGPVPDGMTLDHVCHSSDPACPGGPCPHRACVRPDHLKPVTFEENLRRRRGTHCHRGHELTDDNLYARGDRHCVTCHRENARAQRARQRALHSQGVPA